MLFRSVIQLDAWPLEPAGERKVGAGQLGREVLRHKDDPKAVREIGTEWAVAQSRELVEAGVPVLHYYPMGKADNIIKIAKAIF